MAHTTSGAADTFPKLLRENAGRMADLPASREKEFGIWQSWTWAQVHEETRALAMGLMELGLKPGERMAIIGTNRPHLYWSMTAAQMIGAIPVPIYHDGVAEEMQYVLEHAEVAFVVAEDQEQVDKMLSIQDRLPSLRHVIYSDPRGLRKYDHTTLHPYDEIQKLGRENEAEHGAEIDRIVGETTGGDTCVMLYTSGTTGRPKGVVLSHDNLLIMARAGAEFDGLKSTDSAIAYLPMAWVGDFIFSMGQSYVTGMCIACPESQDTLMHDIREIGPTYFFAPPRMFEGLLTNLTIRMEDAGRIKKWLFDTFIAHAK
ncbi:MAG: AMP-binding protein, partial [Pseudomonadota bacterium]